MRRQNDMGGHDGDSWKGQAFEFFLDYVVKFILLSSFRACTEADKFADS
jgi:hypothetical protein